MAARLRSLCRYRYGSEGTMKISRPSSRTIALAGSLLVLSSTAVLVLAQGTCPPIIAALFPHGASIRDGQYRPGDMGMGNGSADLSFENPSCARARFSARVRLEVKHYGGETAILIKSAESPYGSIDRDAVREQFMTDATSELAQTRLAPKRERVGIGEIVWVERMSECPPEGPATYAARVGPMIVPNVKLRGVAWAGNANLQVTLDGAISPDLARAAVAEVFANLQKADFSKAR